MNLKEFEELYVKYHQLSKEMKKARHRMYERKRREAKANLAITITT
jgi:hypothetical protein